MEETKYVATPGKTFLCFVIYQVVITITSKIFVFFLTAMLEEILTSPDRVHNILFASLMILTLFSAF